VDGRARTVLWTRLLRRVTLHCTRRPSVLTTELHGQVNWSRVIIRILTGGCPSKHKGDQVWNACACIKARPKQVFPKRTWKFLSTCPILQYISNTFSWPNMGLGSWDPLATLVSCRVICLALLLGLRLHFIPSNAQKLLMNYNCTEISSSL